MVTQTKNMMIALFVIAASVIIIFMIFFLQPTIGDEGQTLRVRFDDIDKVNVGTLVNYAGKPVGTVTDITELVSAETGRIAKNGTIYVYELGLNVDSSVNVFNTDEILLRTSGLLGEKSVTIFPRPPKEGQKVRHVNKEILYAKETGSVEETLKEFKEMSDIFGETLENINVALNEIKEQDLIKNMSDSFKSFTKTSESFKLLANQITKGQGTIGKLLFEDDLYLRFTSIMNKAETTMNDINHYGLLFHLDKGWQRLRARQLNLLQKLRSPQEFRNYFNDELDKLNTSLSRVGMVMENSYRLYPSGELMCDPEFQKVFAELLRRIEGLEEELKMYNQQLVDKEVTKTELVR